MPVDVAKLRELCLPSLSGSDVDRSFAVRAAMPEVLDELEQLRAMASRLDALEAVAHKPVDFTHLVDRIGALEGWREGQTLAGGKRWDDADPDEVRAEVASHAGPTIEAGPGVEERVSALSCSWTNLDDQIDLGAPRATCPNDATHTTCDPRGGVVCDVHKCRCSKPLK